MKPDDLIDGGLIRDTDLDGEPFREPAELGPFGRYVLIEELGRGGAAIVYRALDPLLNRELALKRLRFGDQELEARFLRESELLARLSHSGIVPIFDFGREGDSLYYTMPLAAGLSLDRWAAERRPDAREAARIVRQAAEALAHAHEHGVLHRDVKPANILVNAEGAALLADFGLGRVEGPESGESGRVTQSGEMMGTPNYMAPELATRDLKGADARCDVYSMGATLYETLTGRPPFIGRSSLEILKRATAEEPVGPRKLAPNTPADLEIICLKALEKDPARRYATVREMADDLGRFLAGEPIRARRASFPYRLRRFMGRRRAVVAVAVAGVLLASGVLVTVALRDQARAARKARSAIHLEKAEEHLRGINSLMRDKSELDSEVRKQAESGFERIRQALAEDPRSGRAHYLKGRIHGHLFETDLARESFNAAIASESLPSAFLERCILDAVSLFFDQWNFRISAHPSVERDRLAADLKMVLKVTERPADIGFAQAIQKICESPPDWEGAARHLERYTAEIEDWRAHFWMGVILMSWAESLEEPGQTGPLERAAASLERARGARSNCWVTTRILERLALARFWLKDATEAERLLNDAIRREPSSGDLRYHLAVMLLDRTDYDGAIREAQAAWELGPKRPDARGVLGLARSFKHEKDPSGGRSELEKAKADLQAALGAFKEGTDPYQDLIDALRYVEAELSKARDY